MVKQKERGKKTFHNNIPNRRITEKPVVNRLVECNGLTVLTFGLFPEIAKKSEFTLVSTVSGMIRFIYKVGREASMFWNATYKITDSLRERN